MISNWFDSYFPCFIVIIMKLKQKKKRIRLVLNQFDLNLVKFILTYNNYRPQRNCQTLVCRVKDRCAKLDKIRKKSN